MVAKSMIEANNPKVTYMLLWDIIHPIRKDSLVLHLSIHDIIRQME